MLVARQPFKVYAWVDRGYYRTGDVVHAAFKAQTLDHKPVQGRGGEVHRKGDSPSLQTAVRAHFLRAWGDSFPVEIEAPSQVVPAETEELPEVSTEVEPEGGEDVVEDVTAAA